MREENGIEPILIAWGYRVMKEDDPGLGFKPQPLARMASGGTVFIKCDLEKETDVDRVSEAIGALALFNREAALSLKAKYTIRGSDKKCSKILDCSRSHFQKRLKEGREWVEKKIL